MSDTHEDNKQTEAPIVSWSKQTKSLPPLIKTRSKLFLDTESEFADNESGALAWSLRAYRRPPVGDTQENVGSIACSVRISDCSRWIDLDFSTNRYSGQGLSQPQQLQARIDKLTVMIDSLTKLRDDMAVAAEQIEEWRQEPFIPGTRGDYDDY